MVGYLSTDHSSVDKILDYRVEVEYFLPEYSHCYTRTSGYMLGMNVCKRVCGVVYVCVCVCVCVCFFESVT